MPYIKILFTLLLLVNSIHLQAEAKAATGIIVRWTSETQPALQLHLSDGTIVDQAILIHKPDTVLTRVSVNQGVSIAKLLKAIRSLPGVIYAEPDYPVSMSRIPDDSLLQDQWYLSTVHAYEAWDFGTDCSSVIIATIDTGIDLDHSELIDNLWINPNEIAGNGFDDDGNGIVDDVHGYNALKNSGVPDDDNGHGTHIAGIIAARADNSEGTAGLCWSARVMAIKFLDHFGGGAVSDAVTGIQYALDNRPADTPMIINNSWVINNYSQALEDVLRQADAQDVFVTAAAGNSGADNDVLDVYPTFFRNQFDNMISVANVDQQNELYVGHFGSSNFGVTSVDLAAPGMDIYSTFKNETYKALTGTSMATPMVSAASALALQQRPDLTSRALKAALLASADTADTLQGKLLVPGVLNIQRLLENIFTTPQVMFRAQGENGAGIQSGNRLEISGYGLDNTLEVLLDNQSINFELIDSAKLLVTLPAGAKDALLATNASNSLFIRVVLDPPADINLQLSSLDQPLLSWNNRSNADFVKIERALGNSSYQEVGMIAAPQSVFQDMGVDAMTACYRFQSGFNYTDPYTREVRVKLSGYSPSTSIQASGEALNWSTQTIGSVRKGSSFAEQLSARSLGSLFTINAVQSLPAGLMLSDTGLLSGVPDEAGEFQFDVLLTGSSGCPEQKTIGLTVTETTQYRFLNSQLDGQYRLQTDQGEITRLQSRDLFLWETEPEVSDYEVIDLTMQLSADNPSGTVLLSVNNETLGGADEFRLFAMDLFDEWIELTTLDGVQKTANGFNWAVDDNVFNNELYDLDADRYKMHLKLIVSAKPQARAQQAGDNRCFIASVIYKDAEQGAALKTLRAFRDGVLSSTAAGRFLIEMYYDLSPGIAWWLVEKPFLQTVSKGVIDMIVFFITSFSTILFLLLSAYCCWFLIQFKFLHVSDHQ